MNEKQLYKVIGFVDDDLIEEAETAKKKRVYKNDWVKWSGIVACLVLFAGISFFYFNNQKSDFSLPMSTGNVTVKYINDAPFKTQNSLIGMTEDELFHADTSIFQGTITEIRNIEVNLNGIPDYKALAKIKVDKVYRGEPDAGETISLLLPDSIQDGTWTEDTGVVSSMKEGMKGIFMPVKYDETSTLTENNATLYLLDLAEYGLLDGERFAFLNTDKGLVFARDAYPSISEAASLEEIERYIEKMIR